ncbi:RNA polymerase sigma factor, sigma-70 family [Flavobacterium succinicans]|uniref:RNA polymerase sigma factor, sigma-70 family n=1 Tax=Flavobacterium succinicans TaxID=29536 RepID=A0A1I4TBA1_9FLAO|nr:MULTISPECIES: sigma-70 family RNA polymerase sigma factor [Flavobacterium]OOV27676.1 RNA polymerase subunit sigma-24 [Flavobacterium sp. LM5]SFM73847.1 RNA polymerase sigma factor, sigma-70 family [Flavobacterium succinicans]
MKSTTEHIKEIDDAIVWKQLINGNEKAFSTLFDKYFNQLVLYGNSFSSNEEKVKDCIQDVFVDVWLYRNSLNENIAPKTYLLSCVRKRIARQHGRDRIFTKATSTKTLEFLFDFSVEHKLIIDEDSKNKVIQLNKLINLLPSKQKEVLYLRYHQELSIDQIAEILNINYQSTSNLLHRSLLKLRKDWSSIIYTLLIFSKISSLL